MSIPVLETCCCGCSLKTGTKIIGWLNLVCGIVMLILFGSSLAGFYYIEAHPEIDTPEAMELRQHLPALKTLAMFLIVLHTISSILAFILLLGSYQSKAVLVFIWVVVALTTSVVSALITIGQMLTVYQSESLMSLLSFVVEMYFILVVYSFYREIRNVSTNYF